MGNMEATMQDREKIIREILTKSKANGWTEQQIAEEIWDAAVEWAGGLVDYSS